MKKKWLPLFALLTLTLLSGCVNKHGISLYYYSDCKEYYDLGGMYHKECGDDDIITYKEIEKKFKKEKKREDLIEGEPSIVPSR